MPRCLGAFWVGSSEKDSVVGFPSPGGPNLLSLDHPIFAIAFGPRRQCCEIRARSRLGKQLAPEFFAAQDRPQEPLFLPIVTGGQDGRTRPADPDRVVTVRIDPGRIHFLSQDELMDRIRRQTPR